LYKELQVSPGQAHQSEGDVAISNECVFVNHDWKSKMRRSYLRGMLKKFGARLAYGYS